MTAPTIERDPSVDEAEELADVDATGGGPDEGSGQRGPGGPDGAAGEPAPRIAYRPLLAAAFATAAAGLVTGGIFGSWSARLLGLFASFFGVFWAWLTLRSRGRETTYQALLVPASLLVGLILLIPTAGGPSRMPQLMSEAITSGRLLRPPVPFDPGWRPLLMVIFALLGFAAAWIATALERPRLAIAVPLPVLALTAITQPDDGEFIAGLCAFVPLLAALAVLFGGDSMKASELTKDFELKRAARGVGASVVALGALVALGNAGFLFPEPAFDPDDQPQKPKPIPLSEIQDRVLFEVVTDSPVTGPWKTGSLDVYDGEAWKLPPFDESRFRPIPPDGVVNPDLAEKATEVIEFRVRDLGDASVLPGTTTPAKVDKPADVDMVFDPRPEVFRVPEGRVPRDVAYSIAMPPYPGAEELAEAPAPEGDFSRTLEIPEPPGVIRLLLEEAPAEPAWARLDFLRERFREVVVAVGGGVPVDITPERVVEIFQSEDHEASPFEIVAAEAMLARWAGVPARIGFGFDGLNDEDGVLTVRPRNAAQWLEVYFEGHGWVPLIEAPEEAKQSLDNEQDRYNPDVLASDEVAVELYIPIELENLEQLYERLRELLLVASPYLLLAATGYLATPTTMRQWRRRKRRRWAESIGPRAQIAVEYAEFRDLAHDLNVGDPLDTPLEYLNKLVDDEEHQEFAWLVARALYGDLAQTVSDDDARSAEELSESLRRRMSRGQPFQTRALAAVSKASLRQPYTDEVPNVVLLDPLGRLSAWRRRRRAERAGRRRSWVRLGTVLRAPGLLWRRA